MSSFLRLNFVVMCLLKTGCAKTGHIDGVLKGKATCRVRFAEKRRHIDSMLQGEMAS